MLKKQIYTLIGIALATVLIVVSAWAFKSGKLAGLADVVPQAEINITCKDSQNNPVSGAEILVSSDNVNYNIVGRTDAAGVLRYTNFSGSAQTLYFKAQLSFHSSDPEYRSLRVSPGGVYDISFILELIVNPPQPGTGAITGKITDSQNKAISAAWVCSYDLANNPTGYCENSKSDGTYALNSHSLGTFKVKAVKQGYQEGARDKVIVRDGQITSNVNITLTTETSPTPTPTTSRSRSPSPSASPASDAFSFVAEIVDAETDQKIKDAEVEITPELKPEGGAKATSRDTAIDTTKYGEANVKVDNIYYPGATSCVSTTYNYKLKITHPNYETYESTFECRGSVINYDGENLYKRGKIDLRISEKTYKLFVRPYIYKDCDDSADILGKTLAPDEMIIVDIINEEGTLVFSKSDYAYYGFEFDIPVGRYKVIIHNKNYYVKQELEFKGTYVLLIELKPRDEDSVFKSSGVYSGLKVEFVGFNAQKYRDQVDWYKVAARLKSVRKIVGPDLPLFKIVVVDSPEDEKIWAYYRNHRHCSTEDKFIITTAFLDWAIRVHYEMSDMVVHEFGHHYDAYKLEFDKKKRKFLINSYRAALDVGDCPFSEIDDGYIQIGALPSFHNRENDREFFASFFHAYYNYHDRLYQIISQETTGECQNVLAYMWEFFSQEVGSVRSDDINKFPIKGGKLKIISIRNIRNGSWRADLAKDQSLTERTLADIEAIASDIIASPTVQAAPIAFEKISSSLSRLFFWQKRGNIDITVSELIDGQETPVKGAIVNIGGFCTTNNEGRCGIKDIRAVEHRIKIYDGTKIDSLEFSSEDKVNIETNKTISEVYIVR